MNQRKPPAWSVCLRFILQQEDLERKIWKSKEVRSASRSTSPNACKAVARRSFESAIDQEKLQPEVLEDLVCFRSPRRRCARCTQSLSFNGHERPGSHEDFFRSVGSWVGGFTVHMYNSVQSTIKLKWWNVFSFFLSF